jgi:glycosyltransferase involved in cell wall biosynthesis
MARLANTRAPARRHSTPTQSNPRHAFARTARFLDAVDPSGYDVVAKGGPAATGLSVSVVVPTRNRRDLLSDTIDALLAQGISAGSYEVVVVDNASTDGTTSMLREKAKATSVCLTGIRSRSDRGPAASRNAGVMKAEGRIVAFTDSDCVPTANWLSSLVAAFSEERVGIVQGRTVGHPAQSQPLFNHFIETLHFDGSYSTSNVGYLKQALIEAGGFDPGCSYWEDVDLGWRVRRGGWDAVFASEALVYHQVIHLTAIGWVLNAWRYHTWPAKAARYPEFRPYLVGRLWSHPLHPLFQAFVLGLALAAWRRPFLLFTLPYICIPFRRRLIGRWPLLRAGAHLVRDGVALAALITGSIRFRRLVL